MKFSGVTLDVQQRYDLNKSFWTSSCEYEEWDSAEKLCYLLFLVTPLIGEVCLSQEQYEEFSKKGRELFAKLLKTQSRPFRYWKDKSYPQLWFFMYSRQMMRDQRKMKKMVIIFGIIF